MKVSHSKDQTESIRIIKSREVFTFIGSDGINKNDQIL